jgi:hypothetical protein
MKSFANWAVHVWSWQECDLRAAPINVRTWESNGLNADVAFGPFMTPNAVVETASRLIRKRERGIELWASTAKSLRGCRRRRNNSDHPVQLGLC